MLNCLPRFQGITHCVAGVLGLIAGIGMLPAQGDPIFSGITYQMPDARVEGNPWLLPVYASGTLIWLDRPIEADQLRYDLTLDQLVILTRSGRQEYLIALSPLHVPSFSLENRQFYHARTWETETIPEDLQTGYHELVYDGPEVQLIASHRKSLLSENRSTSIHYYYDYKRPLFLLYKGEFHRIRTKGQFFSVLGAHKREMKALMRERGINLKQSEPADLIPILELFEQLSAES